jgi:hypothetical protein
MPADGFIPDRNHFTTDDIFARQRTVKGIRSERWIDALAERLRADKEMRKRLNEDIRRTKGGIGVTPGAVHANTILSTMSVQYQNDDFIGEQLMPAVNVAKRSDAYAIYPKRERLAYPDDAMGPKGQANELDESRTTDNYSVKDYGYKNFVDAEVIDNEDGAFDEMMDLTQAILEGIAFRREKRIATVLTTGSSYSGNTAALAGANQWDSAAGGDPVKNLLDAKANLWSGRGPSDIVAFCSLDVYNVLARHQAIRDLFKYVGAGLATPDLIAGYFGFAKLLVAAPREDTANAGQTASYSRIWPKSFGLVRVARRASLRNAAFGYTFRLNGDPTTTQWFDPVAGKKGGYWSKVATSEDHKVVAGDTGYLFTTVIS